MDWDQNRPCPLMFPFWYLHILFTWYCWWSGSGLTAICVWLICGITQASHGIATFVVCWMLTSLHILRYTYTNLFLYSGLVTYHLNSLIICLPFYVLLHLFILAIESYILQNPNLHSARFCLAKKIRMYTLTSMETDGNSHLWNLPWNNWRGKCYVGKIKSIKYYIAQLTILSLTNCLRLLKRYCRKLFPLLSLFAKGSL